MSGEASETTHGSHLITKMRTEIGEQPQALRATLNELLPRAAEVKAAVAAGTRQVLFIARGTSDNAAVYGSYLLQVYADRLRHALRPRRWPRPTQPGRPVRHSRRGPVPGRAGPRKIVETARTGPAGAGPGRLAITNSAASRASPTPPTWPW